MTDDALTALAAELAPGAALQATERASVEALSLPAVGISFEGMTLVLPKALGERLAGDRPSTPVTTREEAAALVADAGRVTGATLTLEGEPGHVLVLVRDVAAAIDPDSLRGVPVRVWAELGRTQLPIGRAVGLAPGTVVELDRAADDPVDLYVSGRRFARGSLVLVDGEWAVEVLEILNQPTVPSITPASP